MQKVVLPCVMAEMDRCTIGQGVSAEELMEKAGIACTEIIGAGLSLLDKALVVCGSGNNGGDGLVIARLLAEEGHPVRVLCTADPGKYSPESRLNYEKLLQLDMPVEPEFLSDFSDEALKALFEWSSIIVDCLFGNGLTARPLNEKYLRLIQMINRGGKPVTSIDIPSGLRGDTGFTAGAAVKAYRTIAIQCIKAGCLMNDGPDFCGEIMTVDIGIEGESEMAFFEYSDLVWPKIRNKNSHKYHYGAVAAVVGSDGMYGAGQMACESALTAGAGLVTAYVPENAFAVMASRIAPEIMVQSYTMPPTSIIPKGTKKNVILFGCGIGSKTDYTDFLKTAFSENCPMVIDADGLRCLARNKALMNNHLCPLVLTPHAGELAVLLDTDPKIIASDPIKAVKTCAEMVQACVVFKGYRTMVCSPDGRIRFNSTGNPGMATAGSGDVLAGMIAGIIAQGVDPFIAAIHGVYYHGAAGDIYAGRFNETTLKATDILSFLKVVINDREAQESF